MRAEGSGFANRTTDLIEKLIAAILNGEAAIEADLLMDIDLEYRVNRCGMKASDIQLLIHDALGELRLKRGKARSNPPERLGDVKLSHKDETFSWIELKAQTKKDSFKDITQADWVRDGTDFLRCLYNESDTLAKVIPSDLGESLQIKTPYSSQGILTPAQLWVCDLMLITDSHLKSNAGISGSSDIVEFARSKYVFHICRQGARIFRFDQIVTIASALSGADLDVEINLANRNCASIKVSCPKRSGRGSVDFTYHLGYQNAPGRHKLHSSALEMSTPLVEILL